MKVRISVRKAAAWAAALKWILEPITPERRVTYINKENGERLNELLAWLDEILQEAEKSE